MFRATRSPVLCLLVALAMLVGACAQPQRKEACSAPDSAVSAGPTVTEQKAARAGTCRFVGRIESVTIASARGRPLRAYHGIRDYRDGILIGDGIDLRWLVEVKVETVLNPAPFLKPDGPVYFWVHSPSRDLDLGAWDSTGKTFVFTIEAEEGADGQLDVLDISTSELKPPTAKAE
ncbi:MAG: hypothetical protein ABII12_10430 [Planctomycetota bacterium]